MPTAREEVRDAAHEAAIAGDLAAALDPVCLARRAGIEPDGWQADVLRSTAPRILLNCCRQSGKSTVTALLALHAALYEPGALVLILAPAQRQSIETYRKVKDAYGALGEPVLATVESGQRLELANGSRIVSLPGTEATVRGFSGARLLIVDEAARVADPLYYSVRPMLAVSQGKLVLLSTPFGRRGFFHREWSEGGDDWRRFEVPASDCPRIPAAFLAAERRALGPLFYASEYECKFVETIDSVFAHDDIAAALDASVTPLFGRTG